MEKLCVSADMIARRYDYKNEQAFLSTLPLLALDADVERKSRRNALTSGVAAAFPFASYELSDRNGIFLGLNLYNRSPVFLDPYDDYKYTNGNCWIGGSSGAGKTFTLQCLGGRLRQQGRRVIFIVPKKGHEFRPLCELLGGLYLRLSPSSKDCPNIMAIRRRSLDSYVGLRDMAHSDGWNCLYGLDKEPQLAQTVANTIIQNTSGPREADDFWSRAELNLLMSLIHYVVNLKDGRGGLLPIEQRGLGDVYQLLAHQSIQDINRTLAQLPPDHPAKGHHGLFLKAKENLWGSIAIPGAAPGQPDGFDDVESVISYLAAFGPTVAQRIRSQFQPLFDPAAEPLSEEVLTVNDTIMAKAGYSLYDAQLAVAEATKRQLDHKKVALIVAECGSGKSVTRS